VHKLLLIFIHVLFMKITLLMYITVWEKWKLYRGTTVEGSIYKLIRCSNSATYCSFNFNCKVCFYCSRGFVL